MNELPASQDRDNCLYPETDYSVIYPLTLFPKFHSNLILSSMLFLRKIFKFCFYFKYKNGKILSTFYISVF
jgi:hypothetical protein